jgi:hypothetical protein
VKKLCLAVIVLSLCSLSFAGALSADTVDSQQQAAHQKKAEGSQPVPHSVLATDVCSFNFTSGANNTFLSYCVTQKHNVLNIRPR